MDSFKYFAFPLALSETFTLATAVGLVLVVTIGFLHASEKLGRIDMS